MKLRWYQESHRYWAWNSRDDAWYWHGTPSEKVLQYLADDGKWTTVPLEHAINGPGPEPKD